MHCKKCKINELFHDSSDTESICSDSSFLSTSTESSLIPYEESDDEEFAVGNKLILSENLTLKENVSLCRDKLNSILNKSQNIYQNVRINKSRKVHLGNITYINGPIHVNVSSSTEEPIMSFSVFSKRRVKITCKCKSKDYFLEVAGKLEAACSSFGRH